jgi:hypothetical protein
LNFILLRGLQRTSKFFKSMNFIKTLISSFSIATLTSCSPSAPPTNRLPAGELLDENYLKEVYLPAIKDKDSKIALQNSISKLDEELVEFRAYMKDVETGDVKVKQSIKGNWQSFSPKGDYFLSADYQSETGIVSQFDKRVNRDPYTLIDGFMFYPNGHLRWVEISIGHGFNFDEQGKVTGFY